MIRNAIAVVGGAAALALAVVAGFAPSLLPSAVTATLDSVPAVSMLGQATAAVTFLVACRWLWASSTDTLPDMPGRPDDGKTAPVVGAVLDDELAAASAVGEQTAEAEARVRSNLRQLAIDTYQQAARCDRATAARAVETGTWTDDPAAAAFIGGPDAPTVPRRVWFRDALSDDGPFHRQTVRTIRAIDALGRADPGNVPDSDGGATVTATDASSDSAEVAR